MRTQTYAIRGTELSHLMLYYFSRLFFHVCRITSNQFSRKDELGQEEKSGKRAENGIPAKSALPFFKNLKSLHSLRNLTSQTTLHDSLSRTNHHGHCQMEYNWKYSLTSCIWYLKFILVLFLSVKCKDPKKIYAHSGYTTAPFYTFPHIIPKKIFWQTFL